MPNVNNFLFCNVAFVETLYFCQWSWQYKKNIQQHLRDSWNRDKKKTSTLFGNDTIKVDSNEANWDDVEMVVDNLLEINWPKPHF